MRSIILAGAGGCMREIAWQIQELNKSEILWKIEGYVDNQPPETGEGVWVGSQMIPYLGNDDVLLNKKESVNVAICVGTPALRKKIAEKLVQNPSIQFPNIILGDSRVCEDAKMGKGCIVSMDARISTNVTLGDFVFLNTGSMVCHDGWLGDYVTLSPDVKLAGNVSVEAECELGMGAKVIQGVSIGKGTTIGAGAVVVNDIEPGMTAVGVPARKIIR